MLHLEKAKNRRRRLRRACAPPAAQPKVSGREGQGDPDFWHYFCLNSEQRKQKKLS